MSKQSQLGSKLGMGGAILIGISGILQMVDGSLILGMTVLGFAMAIAGWSIRESTST